jgi:hypothetical protein
MIRKGLLMLAAAAGALPLLAQWQLVPLPRTPEPVPKKIPVAQGRTQSAALTLPFWDDFSFARGEFPVTSLYTARQSVWVNTSMGIRPPSLGVVTFDGLDSLGRPYSQNDVLAKGFADRLVSRPIRLNLVPEAHRGTVFFSFFYQFQGNGEPPDEGDVLSLYFRNANGEWERVWTMENRGQLQNNRFTQVILPVGAAFFHEGFQFRFQNFARLSGPYDTWNIDYIYINRGRNSTDTSYPDRTLVTPPGSSLATYFSMPYRHFRALDPLPFAPAAFTIHNLRVGNLQPLSFNSRVTATHYIGTQTETRTQRLDSVQSVGAVDGLEFRDTQTNRRPSPALFDSRADSVTLRYVLNLNSGDNIPITEPLGDYTPNFIPIDFRNNDTTRQTQTLSNYYAYDDGTAEFGAGLNQAGAQVAYQFDLKGVPADTVVAVDLYFPRFGDESQQVITLQIWSTLAGAPVHQQVITVERSQNNILRRRRLSAPVIVGRRFFIGWRQTATAVIAVGLDKDSDSSDKIFVNTAGTWAPSTQLRGSLMMRPVFGSGPGALPPTGLTAEQAPVVFPNPSDGAFFLPAGAQVSAIVTGIGQPLEFSARTEGDLLRVDLLSPPASGLVVVRYHFAGYGYATRVWMRGR